MRIDVGHTHQHFVDPADAHYPTYIGAAPQNRHRAVERADWLCVRQKPLHIIAKMRRRHDRLGDHLPGRSRTHDQGARAVKAPLSEQMNHCAMNIAQQHYQRR